VFLDRAVQLLGNRTLAKLPEFDGYYPVADYDALAADAEKKLVRVFDELEFMLQDGKFLQGADEVSIADLSLVCEMMQLQVCISQSGSQISEFASIGFWYTILF